MTAPTRQVREAARARRACLAPAPNPANNLDWVIELHAASRGPGPSLTIRYVPFRLLVTAAAFRAYVDALDPAAWPALEGLAVAVLDDLNDELVPCWVQIAVTIAGEDGFSRTHAVIVEDRQPGWDNPGLLARLRPL
jgi:hypothetical protein